MAIWRALLTAIGASGGAFVALSRREVGSKYVERAFEARQPLADFGSTMDGPSFDGIRAVGTS